MSELKHESAVEVPSEVLSSIEIVDSIPPTPEPLSVNKQLYQNSALAGSPVESLVNELTNGLFQSQKPNLAILHEKAHHRLILLLKLKGLSNREVAKQMEMSEAWVSQITRQPWFQLALVQELKETKEEIVDSIVKVEATNAIYKLVNLMQSAKSEEVQKSCAVEILNRHLGKPIQRTEHSGEIKHKISDLDDINAELAELEKEEKKLLRGTESTVLARN